MYTVTLIASAIILYVSMKIFKKKKNKTEFPEPPASIIFGHLLQISSIKDVLGAFSKFIQEPGKTAQFRFGPSFAPFIKAVVTADYKLIEFILSSNQILTKSANYQFLKPWLRNGLLISDGAYWRRHRKILTPTIHFDFLKNSVDVFETVGSKFIENLENSNVGDSVDIHPLATLCTLDIICETTMGTKINVQNGENGQYVKSVKELCRIVMERSLKFLKYFNATFWLTRDYYIQKDALKIAHDLSANIIKSREATAIHRNDGGKLAFLDMLLEHAKEEKMSFDEVQEEVDTIMFGGHDTTATALSFTLYCLANHSGIQNKALQEQKNLFANEKNPEITLKDLQNMKYLENVIKESLRLYPPVPLLGRHAREDIEFEGRTISKGSDIVIFVFGIHRNEEYFPEPEKFKPDRFDNFSPLPYTYLPFSAGPRNCLGQKFVMLELKSVISKIIRHFELRPAVPKHELDLIPELVLQSVTGIRIGFIKRN